MENSVVSPLFTAAGKKTKLYYSFIIIYYIKFLMSATNIFPCGAQNKKTKNETRAACVMCKLTQPQRSLHAFARSASAKHSPTHTITPVTAINMRDTKLGHKLV